MPREIFFISNILSLSRIVLVCPVYYCLKLATPAGNLWAVFFMLVAVATDSLDGRLARRLGQQSDLGRILDPLADKTAVTILIILLVQMRDLPVWFVALAISRDILILTVALYLMRKTHHVVESNMLGKITVTALAILIITYTLQLGEPAELFVLWSSVVLIVASTIGYSVKIRKTLMES
jgi:CDP-diacylglycerol--glycerol-3-phosphate 3-phosphatidyltransferase